MKVRLVIDDGPVRPLYRITAADLSRIFIAWAGIMPAAAKNGYSAASVLPADARRAGMTSSAKRRRLFSRFASP